MESCPRIVMKLPRGKNSAIRVHHARQVSSDSPEVAILHRGVDVYDTPNVVVADHFHFVCALDGGNIRQDFGMARCGIDRRVL